ncbi:MAG: SUF system FeS assembly protein [candidate division TM6 bacterium GW2011_GWF2_28_16]|nr:MAG: SUF system FeS assembly protein [candidate division TM6 bacterium GW2011_GWF2_28_16]
MNNKIYQERLMEHFKNSIYKNKIANPDFSSGQQNPSCGDSILIEGKLGVDSDTGKNIIKELSFNGSGCVISQAAASILIENCLGKTVEEILKLDSNDIIKMLGIELGPNRIKCALLSLEALKASLKK